MALPIRNSDQSAPAAQTNRHECAASLGSPRQSLYALLVMLRGSPPPKYPNYNYRAHRAGIPGSTPHLAVAHRNEKAWEFLTKISVRNRPSPVAPLRGLRRPQKMPAAADALVMLGHIAPHCVRYAAATRLNCAAATPLQRGPPAAYKA
ncbi:MAG: Uncharacterised protein [Pseudidiomarina mangrovi]|nr:MAG: Uncharacterised protein [Pseudidiomarina mangrovi]